MKRTVSVSFSVVSITETRESPFDNFKPTNWLCECGSVFCCVSRRVSCPKQTLQIRLVSSSDSLLCQLGQCLS